MPSTIRLHRVFKTTPERLYRAFTNADALVKWLPPHGFVAKMWDPLESTCRHASLSIL